MLPENQIIEVADYRAQRRTFISECRSFGVASSGEPDFGRGRALVAELHFHASYVLSKKWGEPGDVTESAKRILRIPAAISKPSGWNLVGAALARLAKPALLKILRARQALQAVGSYQGRAFLFEQLVKNYVDDLGHYTESLDVILTRMSPTSFAEIERLKVYRADALRAFVRLGIYRYDDIPTSLSGRISHRTSSLLWLLASKNVIRSIDELAWVEIIQHHQIHRSQVDDEERQHAFRVITSFLDAGVSRETIARELSRPSVRSFEAPNLSKSIQTLRSLGMDVEEALKATGAALWEAAPSRWRFMTEVVGLDTPSEIARFIPTLTAYSAPSEPLIRELRSLGATVGDLEACQPLWRALQSKQVADDHLVSTVQLLTAEPFCVPMRELANYERYFEQSRDLPVFLDALKARGYGTREALLAFQPCYQSAANKSLPMLLDLAAPRLGKTSVEDLAAWVDVAGRGGYVYEIAHLTENVNVASLSDLHTVTKLAPLGRSLISWLISAKSLTTLKGLKGWYQRAVGIVGLKLWGTLKPTDLVLLEHAWSRNHYSLVPFNQKVIDEVAGEFARARMGPFPFKAEESVRDAYQKRLTLEEQRVLDDVLKLLPSLLENTGGTLVPSILQAALANDGTPTEAMAAFAPTLKELMAGRGPAARSLSTLESESIALVYGVDQSTLGKLWDDVLEVEPTPPVSATGPFSLQWKASRHEATEPLDQTGLTLVRRARDFADVFTANYPKNIDVACGHLRARTLTRAAELKHVANHLGVLLAVCAGSAQVSGWTAERLNQLAELSEGDSALYPEVLSLVKLFDEDLVEALRADAPTFISTLSQPDAVRLATRIGFNGTATGELAGAELLKVAISVTQEIVLPLYRRWAAAQLRKFKETGAEDASLSLSAVVTKHPAAFFARSGVNLCTSADVSMWREARHAHLVAYDLVASRMAAMAYLYVEDAPSVSAAGPVLVIRAINTTEALLAEYAAESLVKEFFRVAIRIAEENQINSVCFCDPDGVHLMSNSSRIEDDVIKPNYVKRAKAGRIVDGALEPTPSLSSPVVVDAKFSAYSTGKQVVPKLYVIWQAGHS